MGDVLSKISPAQRQALADYRRGRVAAPVLYEGKLYVLFVTNTLFMDWGFGIYEIEEDGYIATKFYSPCFLSSDSYGFHDELDEVGERRAWTPAEWNARLESEAWDLVDSLIPKETQA